MKKTTWAIFSLILGTVAVIGAGLLYLMAMTTTGTTIKAMIVTLLAASLAHGLGRSNRLQSRFSRPLCLIGCMVSAGVGMFSAYVAFFATFLSGISPTGNEIVAVNVAGIAGFFAYKSIPKTFNASSGGAH